MALRRGTVSIAFEYLNDFLSTPDYQRFEDWYVSKRPNASGDKWADADFGKLLKMFEYPNGAKQIGKVKNQHSSSTTLITQPIFTNIW